MKWRKRIFLHFIRLMYDTGQHITWQNKTRQCERYGWCRLWRDDTRLYWPPLLIISIYLLLHFFTFLLLDVVISTSLYSDNFNHLVLCLIFVQRYVRVIFSLEHDTCFLSCFLPSFFFTFYLFFQFITTTIISTFFFFVISQQYDDSLPSSLPSIFKDEFQRIKMMTSMLVTFKKERFSKRTIAQIFFLYFLEYWLNDIYTDYIILTHCQLMFVKIGKTSRNCPRDLLRFWSFHRVKLT